MIALGAKADGGCCSSGMPPTLVTTTCPTSACGRTSSRSTTSTAWTSSSTVRMCRTCAGHGTPCCKRAELAWSAGLPHFLQGGLTHAAATVIAGHVHAYDRSYPVNNYTVDPCGTTHVLIGDGGKSGGVRLQSLGHATRHGSAHCRALLWHPQWCNGFHARRPPRSRVLHRAVRV